MKKLFLTIFLFVNFCGFVFAAIPSTMVWEVRTTGNSANGGGFNSARGGTDYSQQDAAQLSLTDLACASNTTLTSATGGFTAAMVGNVIYIASGTNAAAGYYEITAYTDANTVTIDRTCASGGNMTDGVGKVGGATNHPQTIASAVVNSNFIWIKSGTYTSAGTNVIQLQVSGSITWEGYKTTRGDYPTGDDRVIIDGETARRPLDLNSKTNNVFKNIIFKRSNGIGVNGTNSPVAFINVRITANASDGISRLNFWNSSFVEIDNNGAAGTTSNDFANFSIGLYFYVHDNAGDGISYPSANSHQGFIGSIFESNSGDGLKIMRVPTSSYGSAFYIIGNIFYNNTGGTSDGFNGGVGDYGAIGIFFNNVAFNNGRYGFNLSPNSRINLFDFNAYYNNGTAGLNNITAGANDVTADPKLNNPGSGDFTLQSGSPLIGAGIDVATYTSLTTDFNTNIGIDQTNPDGGGGGASTTAYGFSF